MTEVINRQRRRPMDCEYWTSFTRDAIKKIGATGESATVVFVSDRTMRKLNRQFRDLDETTDVLSFQSERAIFEDASGVNLGDIVISVERAAAQALEHDLKFEMEVAQLILHGLLHLRGYNHAIDNGQMNRLELRLRTKLGI